MTSEAKDGGFGDHLKRLRQEEERQKTRRKAQTDLALARSTIQVTEWERKRDERDAQVFQDAHDASREFARLATASGIPTKQIRIFVGVRQRFLGEIDVYENRPGWEIEGGVDSHFVRYQPPDELPRDSWTSPKGGISILTDGTCLMGTPSRLTPLWTPDKYLAPTFNPESEH